MLFELCADNRDFEVPRIFGSRSRREMMLFSCSLVLDSVTSAPQCIRQPRQRVYLKEGTYHMRLFRGPSPNGMKKTVVGHRQVKDQPHGLWLSYPLWCRGY